MWNREGWGVIYPPPRPLQRLSHNGGIIHEFWVCWWKPGCRCENKRKEELLRARGRKTVFFLNFKTLRCLRGERSVHFDLWGDETPSWTRQEEPQKNSANFRVCKRLCKNMWGYECAEAVSPSNPISGESIFAATFLKSAWPFAGFFFPAALPPPRGPRESREQAHSE